MKKYAFFTAIVFALVLTSCSADSEEITNKTPEKFQQFDSFETYAREGDSLRESDPLKPKTRD